MGRHTSTAATPAPWSGVLGSFKSRRAFGISRTGRSSSTPEASASSSQRTQPTLSTATTNIATTSFLLGNFHCPTCAHAIQQVVRNAYPSSPSSTQDPVTASTSVTAGVTPGTAVVRWVSPNLVTSVVTVEHLAQAGVIPTLRRALEDAGFDVVAVTTDSPETEELRQDAEDTEINNIAETQLHQPASAFANINAGAVASSMAVLTRWFAPSSSPGGRMSRDQRARVHLENCEQCRAAAATSATTSGTEEDKTAIDETFSSATAPRDSETDASGERTSPINSSTSPVPIHVTVQRQPEVQHLQQQQSARPIDKNGLYRASLAIAGMTCASCAHGITNSLNSLPWVSSATVSLLSHSAVVDVTDREKAEQELVDVVEGLGYECALLELEPLSQPSEGQREKEGNEEARKANGWEVGLAIGGMTCASCVKTVEEELRKREGVREVVVSLLTNSAKVIVEDRALAEQLVQAVEEMGYDCTLDSVTPIIEDVSESAKSTSDNEEESIPPRTVEIHITGLYCTQCPSRIITTLERGFPRHNLQIISPPTLASPLLKLTYTPQPPKFTIRTLLAAIESTSPNFRATLHHPPTLEERSKQLAKQHRWQILIRIILTALIAVPTFVIGIVYMTLLPSHKRHTDPSVAWLMSPWKSGLSRAQIILFALATPVYFFGADLFHRRAVKEILRLWRGPRRPPLKERFLRFGSMNTLMSLGTTVAYVSSVGQMVAAGVEKPEKVDEGNFYFDSVVFLTLFLLLGRWIESVSKARTGDAVEGLVKLKPSTAILVEGYTSSESDGEKFPSVEEDTVVQADLLDQGDVIRILSGSSPPADGVILRGTTVFDESSLTGESRPVPKQPGDPVYAGTVNAGSTPILARVTGAAGRSMLDQIVRVVKEGQTRRAPIEQIADVLTSYFVPVVTALAVVTWVVWLVLGLAGAIPRDWLASGHDMDVDMSGNSMNNHNMASTVRSFGSNGGRGGWVAFSLQFAIAVFVVACPCGLALAAPTAIFVGSGLAARYGVLAKGGGEAFEKASRVGVVVFDKTGTLTVGGEPKVTDFEVFAEDEEEILAALRVVEENSSHPVAKAIVAFCAAKTSSRANITSLEELPGRGICATLSTNVELAVGNESLLSSMSIPVPQQILNTLGQWQSEAKSTALVAIRRGSDSPWTVSAALAITDPIRPEAPRVLHTLQHTLGLRVWMLSGDNPRTARAVASRLGIPLDQVLAGVLPTGKADAIKQIQASVRAQRSPSKVSTRGAKGMVAMVGDGINDSPALATADVGVAVGSGADVAISSADFVLVKSHLDAVVDLLDLSKTVFNRIRINFAWAVVYNMVALPVAAGVLYPVVSGGKHVKLDPVWASLAMALSSISVVMSSLALRVRIRGIGFRPRKRQAQAVEGQKQGPLCG